MANALKHDAMGFLQGEPLDMKQLVGIWEAVRDDLQAIRKALEAGASSPPPAAEAQRQQAATPAKPASLTGNPGQVLALHVAPPAAQPVSPSRKADAVDIAAAVTEAVRSSSNTSAARAQAARDSASLRTRDANGRFAAGGSSHPTEGSGPADRNGGSSRMGPAVPSMAGAEQVDPTFQAGSEIARPIARTYEAMFGGSPASESKQQGNWLRKIWQSLNITRGEGKATDKAMLKSLKGIEEGKPNAAPRSKSSLGALGAPLGGGGGIAGALMKGGKGLLKKVPIIGGLLAMVGGLGELFDSESSDMTRAEKDKKSGAAIGGVAGTVGGMWAGASLGASIGAIGGPIGAAIGGVVGGAAGLFFGDQAGQVVGGKVGEWVTELRSADIPGKFTAASDWIQTESTKAFDAVRTGWDAVTGKLSDLWGAAAKKASDIGGAISDKASSANSWIKEKTGVDVGGAVGRAWTTTKTAASEAATAVTSKASEVASSTGQAIKNSTVGKGVSRVAAAGKQAFGAHQNRVALLKEMEANGIDDPKERAMMLAQMDHESGGFSKLEEGFNYRSADRIMAVSGTAKKQGKAAVEAAMGKGPEAVAELMYGGRMGNKDPGDGYKFRGRGHVQLTGKDNYEAAGKALGLDLVNNPDQVADPEVAAKVSMWYWKKNKLGTAAQAGDVAAVTKKINGGSNGLDDRKSLYDKYMANPVAPATAVAATQPAPAAAPAVASPAKPEPAPAVPTAVASAGGGRGFVNPAPVEPGQDLTDRRLAHIATGGYSAG